MQITTGITSIIAWIPPMFCIRNEYLQSNLFEGYVHTWRFIRFRLHQALAMSPTCFCLHVRWVNVETRVLKHAETKEVDLVVRHKQTCIFPVIYSNLRCCLSAHKSVSYQNKNAFCDLILCKLRYMQNIHHWLYCCKIKRELYR